MQKQISQKNGYRRKMEHLSKLINTGIKSCSWKTPLGSQKLSVIAKTVKCTLCIFHWNADNERRLSVKEETLSKERFSFSIVTPNGLQATDGGIRNGLSNMVVTKEMLSPVRGLYKAYSQHIDKEKGKKKKKSQLIRSWSWGNKKKVGSWD